MSRLRVTAAFVIAALAAVVIPAHAQGNGNGKGNGNGNGNANGHQSQAPSSNALPSPVAAAPASDGAAPFAWVDDASVLPPGVMVVSVSIARWQGTDLSEVEAPIVGVSVGVAPRLQIGASVPHVMANELNGVDGGLDTVFLNAKIAVLTSKTSSLRVAIAPTLEILGPGALRSLSAGSSRTQFGLPVSAEIGSASLHGFASAGFFSQGVWYIGGGVGGTLSRRMAASASFSKSWTTKPIGTGTGDRGDVSGTLAYSVHPKVSVYGSLGTTVATSDLDGAGTTVSGGVVFMLAARK